MRPVSYDLNCLRSSDVAAIVERDPRLLFPVGSFQTWAPHLPLGTDTIVAERLVAVLSEELGILRAPCLPFGVTQGSGKRTPGAAGLTRKTLHRCVNELLAGWEEHGISEFVIVTAHHHDPHVDALLMALTSSATTTVIDLDLIDVRDLLEESPERQVNEVETSLIMYLAPECIRSDAPSEREGGKPEEAPHRTEEGHVAAEADLRPSDAMLHHSGSPDSPEFGAASAEKGREIFRRYRVAVRAALSR